MKSFNFVSVIKNSMIFGLALILISSHSKGESLDTLDGILKGTKKNASSTQSLETKKHWYSNYQILAGLKSQNSFGRASAFGQSFKSREEIFFGMKNQNGWGFNIVAGGVFKSGSSSNSNSDSKSGSKSKTKTKQKPGGADDTNVSATNANGYGAFEDRAGASDPSLSILHPVFDDGTVSVAGMIKETFPLSERSKSNNSWTQGYYSVLSIKMSHRYHFSNTVMLHYFSRGSYVAPLDSLTSIGIMSSLNRRVADWCRIGIGQRSQMDNHLYGPAGTSTEIFTLADFNITQNILAGPRLHFPIAAQNSVFSETPTTPSTANIQAEIYFQASL